MDPNFLLAYAEEVKALKEREEKIEEMRAYILTTLQAEGIDVAKTQSGTFTIVPRTTYEYPPDVDAKKRIWEDAKKNAITNEKVTKTETLSLRFQAV